MAILAPLCLAAAAAFTATQPQAERHDAVIAYSAGIEAIFSAPKDARIVPAIRDAVPRLTALCESAGISLDANAIALVHDLLSRPFCLRVGQDDAAGFFAQVSVHHVDESEAFRTRESLAEWMSREGFRLEAAGEPAGDRLTSMTPVGPLSIHTEPASTGSNLVLSVGSSRSETFEFEDTGLPAGVEPNVFVKFDGARIGAMIRPLVSMVGDENVPVVAQLALELFGRPDSHVHTYASGLGGGRTIAVCRSIGGATAGRNGGTLVEETLTPADFARVPNDATWASIGQLRPAAYLEQLGRLQPEAVEGTIEQIKAMTGIDARADLLNHIGPTVTAYTSRSTGGGFFSGILLFESDDTNGLSAAAASLWNIAAPMLAAETEGRVDMRTWNSNGTQCATLVFPGLPIPVEPSFACKGGVVVCALGRASLRAALDQLDASDGLASHARLAKLPERALTGLSGFAFYDTPRFVIGGYGSMTIGAHALANLMHEQGNPADLAESILPAPRELASAVQPTITFQRINGDDIVSTTIRDASWLVRCSACLGGPLGESQMVTMAVPIIASISIPKLMTARGSANESAAIATLRSLSAAQAQLQATGVIDTDNDGAGEYGYFGELTGTSPFRVSDGRGGSKRGTETLNPPFLPMSLSPQSSPSGQGVVLRSGYVFQIWLPDANMQGVAEEPAGGASHESKASADNRETLWCAYAWPAEPNKTGKRVFCITSDGDILVFDNAGGFFGGLPGEGRVPAFDAAISPSAPQRGWTMLGR